MKHIFLFTTLLLIIGCVAVDTSSMRTVTKPQVESVNPLTKMEFVFIGMSLDEVKGVLGDQLAIGYVRNQADQSLQPITLDSPYKKDSFSNATGQYEVLYYYTHVAKADGIIAEDEMTPLVFEQNKLIGKGWDFLFRLKNNQ